MKKKMKDRYITNLLEIKAIELLSEERKNIIF